MNPVENAVTPVAPPEGAPRGRDLFARAEPLLNRAEPVSYTRLTLPTICSV